MTLFNAPHRMDILDAYHYCTAQRCTDPIPGQAQPWLVRVQGRDLTPPPPPPAPSAEQFRQAARRGRANWAQPTNPNPWGQR